MFTKAMQDLGFKASLKDPCLFIKDNVHVIAYVDDMLIFGKDQDTLTSLKERIKDHFMVKDLGEVNHFLGIKIQRDMRNKRFHLSQETLITDLLERHLENKHGKYSTPMGTDGLKRKDHDKDNKSIGQVKYQNIVGSLLYLARHT